MRIKIGKINNKNYFKLSILLFLAGFSSFAQQIVISGKIIDSLKIPLPYANILAIPESDTEDIKFAITLNNGTYKLGLSKNKTYNITVSYLGFKPQTITITTTKEDLLLKTLYYRKTMIN